MVIKKQHVISWLLDDKYIPTMNKITISQTDNPNHLGYLMNRLKWLSEVRDSKRAAWDEEGNRWLFSLVDVIAVLTESKNPRNYWKVMKHRLIKDGNELVTRCNQLKLLAADGKRYLTDCLPQSDMLQLMEATPSRHAMTFAKWLIAGENQLDSKSRDKAYQLWDSTLLQTIEVGTAQGLQ